MAFLGIGKKKPTPISYSPVPSSYSPTTTNTPSSPQSKPNQSNPLAGSSSFGGGGSGYSPTNEPNKSDVLGGTQPLKQPTTSTVRGGTPPLTRSDLAGKGINAGANTKTNVVRVSPTGQVSYNGNRYSGQAYINDLGMTTNQYNRYIKQQAQDEGIVKLGQQNQYSYTITNPKTTSSDTISPATQSSVYNYSLIEEPKKVSGLKKATNFISSVGNILSNPTNFKVENGMVTAQPTEFEKYQAKQYADLYFKQKMISPTEETYQTQIDKEIQKGRIGQVALGLSLGVVAEGSGSATNTFNKNLLKEDLANLNKQPTKYFEDVNKQTGIVKLKGYQSNDVLSREINIAGRIQKTESGKQFVPNAKGYSTLSGEVRQVSGNKQIFGINTFKTGSKGVSIPYKNIGNIQWYKTLQSSGYQPVGSTYALYQKGIVPNKVSNQLLRRQFQKNINLGGSSIKDISQGNIFELKPEKLYLGVKKDREIGLTFVKQAKPDIESNIISPANIKKTPLSKTFGSQESNLINQDIVTRGITGNTISPIETKTITLKPVSTSSINQPSLISKENTKNIIGLNNNQNQATITSQKEISVVRQTSSQTSGQKNKTKQIELIKTGQNIGQTETQIQKTRQQLKQTLLMKQQQKQSQAQRLKQVQEFKSPKNPKIIPIIPPINLFKQAKESIQNNPNQFEAFGFRFGKEVKLGKGSKQEAEKLLGDFLKGTLGASGFLTTGKNKVKAKDTGLLNLGYTTSKRSPFIVVEPKTKRLKKSSQETTEIQYFRKKGRKSKSIFGL